MRRGLERYVSFGYTTDKWRIKRGERGTLTQFSKANLLGHYRARHDRKAEAGGGQTLQRFRAACFHHDLKRVGHKAGFLQVVVDDFARSGTHFATDVGVFHQRLRRRERLLRQRVRWRAHDLQLIFTTHVGAQRWQVRIALDESEIKTALRDSYLYRCGIGDKEPRHDRRIKYLECAEDRRQQEVGDGGAGANQQRAGNCPLNSFMRESSSADRARMRSAYSSAIVPSKMRLIRPCARSKRRVFNCSSCYLKSHGRLRHEQRLCRLGERQVFRHGIENLESSIRHVGNRS